MLALDPKVLRVGPPTLMIMCNPDFSIILAITSNIFPPFVSSDKWCQIFLRCVISAQSPQDKFYFVIHWQTLLSSENYSTNCDIDPYFVDANADMFVKQEVFA